MEDFKACLLSYTLKIFTFQVPNIKMLLKIHSAKTQLARWQWQAEWSGEKGYNEIKYCIRKRQGEKYL